MVWFLNYHAVVDEAATETGLLDVLEGDSEEVTRTSDGTEQLLDTTVVFSLPATAGWIELEMVLSLEHPAALDDGDVPGTSD